MSDENRLKVSLPSTMPTDTSVEKIVDDEIKAFGDWFQSLSNDPLISPEKAILKTYLAWKLGLKKEEPEGSSP